MFLLASTEGHFRKATARTDAQGEVRIWLEFDDCRLALDRAEATKLRAAIDGALTTTTNPEG
jgi:hypothetical protein